MRKLTFLTLITILIFTMTAAAQGPGQFSSFTDEEYARLMDNTIEWDEIQNLVTYFNPTYRMYADSTDSQKADLTKARDDFKEEMNENIDTIDENLENIKKQRTELSKLPSAMVVDPRTGATAGQAIAQLDATTEMLKQSRQQVKKAIGQGSTSVTKILSTTEDSLRPVREQLAYVVEGLVISYQELLVNRELVEKQISLYNTILSTKRALLSQNMATAAEIAQAELSVAQAQATLTTVDNGIAQLRTAIGMQLGWGPDSVPVIGAVPAPDPAFIDTVNKEADYKKALEENKTYEATGKVSSYQGASAVSQRDRAVNEADALAGAAFDNLYDSMKQKKILYDAAGTTLERARLSKEKAERMHNLGLIAQAEYEGLQMEYLSCEANARLAALSLTQAINDYQWAVRGFMTY